MSITTLHFCNNTLIDEMNSFTGETQKNYQYNENNLKNLPTGTYRIIDNELFIIIPYGIPEK